MSTTLTPGSYGTSILERAPDLTSLLSSFGQASARKLFCAMVCQVQAFYPEKGTVDVLPLINDRGRINGVVTDVEFAVLVDVPIALFGAGTFTVTLPIQVGDECIVLFMDRCIDAWFQSGGQQNQISPRQHSLSDGIAIFGLRNQTRLLEDYSTDALQIRSDDGGTCIELGNNEVTITAATFTVNAANVNINASNAATINSQGTISILSNGQTDIESAGLNTKLDQRIFKQHTHNAVQPGSGVTGLVD